MGQEKGKQPAESCRRCLRPIPAGASRCPNCGLSQVPLSRRFGVLAGIVGAVLVVVVLAVAFLMQPEAPADTVVDQHLETVPVPPPPPPPPPEKEPPLNR